MKVGHDKNYKQSCCGQCFYPKNHKLLYSVNSYLRNESMRYFRWSVVTIRKKAYKNTEYRELSDFITISFHQLRPLKTFSLYP